MSHHGHHGHHKHHHQHHVIAGARTPRKITFTPDPHPVRLAIKVAIIFAIGIAYALHAHVPLTGQNMSTVQGQ